jgi:hypothetical protein
MGRKKIEIDAKEVERLAGEGQAEYQIAASLGVCQDTLAARKRDVPEIAEALERGKRAARQLVETTAFQCALKAKHDHRYQTSLIFWLKTQAGWKDRQHLEITGADGGPLAVSFYLPENGRDDASRT